MRYKWTILLLVAGLASAQELTISGAPSRTMTLTTAAIAKMPRTMITVLEHGKERKYEGVLLRDLLKQAGAPFGDQFKGRNVAAYIYATGRDGYHATLALAEVVPEFQENEIIVADMMDGKTLGPEQGPFRLVVPEDKKQGRSVRMLDRIEVKIPETPEP